MALQFTVNLTRDLGLSHDPIEDVEGAIVVASFCKIHMKYVPSLEDVAIFCIIHWYTCLLLKMGEAAARKWLLLAQNICFQQWVLSFNKFIFIQEFLPSKKIFVHPRSFDGKFSNQHLGPPPTSKEERVGKVWLATNTSLLPATIIQVVNTRIVWKSSGTSLIPKLFRRAVKKF